jgi:hypothetical protein
VRAKSAKAEKEQELSKKHKQHKTGKTKQTRLPPGLFFKCLTTHCKALQEPNADSRTPAPAPRQKVRLSKIHSCGLPYRQRSANTSERVRHPHNRNIRTRIRPFDCAVPADQAVPSQ